VELFPIGTVGATSAGTIDAVSYNMFEPNMGCTSQPVYSTLSTKFKNMSLLTRKQAEPFLVMNYGYDNIFTREFRQLQHFVDNTDDALTSFYAVDWSRGQKPSAISGGAWATNNAFTVGNSRFYSATTNMKSNYIFMWSGTSFKIGLVSAVGSITSITANFTTTARGDLTFALASSSSFIYPIYQVYLNENSLSNFKTTEYIDENINLTEDGGFMYTGTIDFVSKYKI